MANTIITLVLLCTNILIVKVKNIYHNVQDTVTIYSYKEYDIADPTCSDDGVQFQHFISDALHSDTAHRMNIIAATSSGDKLSQDIILPEGKANDITSLQKKETNIPDQPNNMKETGKTCAMSANPTKASETDNKKGYIRSRGLATQPTYETDRPTYKDNRCADEKPNRLQVPYGGEPNPHQCQRLSELNISSDKVAGKVYNINAPSSSTDNEHFAEYSSCALSHDIPVSRPVEKEKKDLYIAFKTNLLYDAVLIPNIGGEVYLNKQWSISGYYKHAWWKSDHRHWYWRTYGGELSVRKWLGRKAKEKPLTGHHLGVYGETFTYDFETGGKGVLADKWSYIVGIEYGYSLPVARRLNLDFVIGLGYMGGEYREYEPADYCYAWTATKKRHWTGPTKAEIALVWLIGHNNFNKRKGDGL